MARVRLSPQASADIIGIWDHIAASNPQAAQGVVDHIMQRADTLAQHPLLGPERADLRPGLRSLSCGQYLLFYTYRDDLIEVSRVLHGARDLPAQFDD